MSKNACHCRRAERKDHVWTWDFVFDRTTSGSALKWLSIVDEFTRECLCLKFARSVTSEDVIDALAELFAIRHEQLLLMLSASSTQRHHSSS
jgi:transposase InsO family protein